MLPARFLREKEISHWFSVPSAAESLHRVGALRPGIFPHLRQTLFCGEPLRWPVTEAWQAAAPNSRVINLYGPTEATIAISYYVVPRRRSRSNDLYGIVPIGQVFEGQHGRIFSRPEAGEQPNRGELWLSGSQVISGYLDAEDDPDAFASGPDGVAWYRTGDAVERDGDGLLHFVGRIDHQLKISGYRVEPAEIEDAIHRAFPACRSVVVRCDRGKRRGLVAAIVCAEEEAPAASAVREACASSLPSYMIPAHVVELASWPVNANGKIDRAAVRRQLEEDASPDVVAEQGAELMKMRSENEIRGAVRRLVSERVDEVSPDDSASLLETTNLDSLGVVELLVAIEEEFSVSIDFVTVDPGSLLSISGLTHHLSTLMDESNGRASDIWLVGDEVACRTAQEWAREGSSAVAINIVAASDLARCVADPFAGPRGPKPWLISVNSTAIIGRAVLARFDGRAVNIHPGRLPDFGGLYAVQWAIRLGESATAATAHFMTRRSGCWRRDLCRSCSYRVRMTLGFQRGYDASALRRNP